MASLIYNGALEAIARGGIDFDTDTIMVLLTTSSYAESKDGHAFRSDVSNEVVGAGYTAGGQTVGITVGLDTATDRVTITLGGATWLASTLTARKAVYYKARGGASSADELIAVIDFGADVATVGGTLTLQASSIRLNNP